MSYADIENLIRDKLNGEIFGTITLTTGQNLFSGPVIDDDESPAAENLSVFVLEISGPQNIRVSSRCYQIEKPNIYITVRSSITGGRQEAKILAKEIYQFFIEGNRPAGIQDIKSMRPGPNYVNKDDKGRHIYNLHFELFRVNQL